MWENSPCHALGLQHATFHQVGDSAGFDEVLKVRTFAESGWGWLPSGNLTVRYWKIHHFSWENPLWMVIFNSYFDITRGYSVHCQPFQWLNPGGRFHRFHLPPVCPDAQWAQWAQCFTWHFQTVSDLNKLGHHFAGSHKHIYIYKHPQPTPVIAGPSMQRALVLGLCGLGLPCASVLIARPTDLKDVEPWWRALGTDPAVLLKIHRLFLGE